MDEAKVIQVIYCTKKRRGKDEIYSPIRVITEIFDLKGNLIAEDDPCGGISPECILNFLKYHYPDIAEQKHKEKIYEYFIEGNESLVDK